MHSWPFGQDVRRYVVGPDALDDEDVAVRVPGSQRQNRLIGRRAVPLVSGGQVGELDHDERSRALAFQHLGLPAMHDEVSIERDQGCVNLLQVLDDRRSHVDFIQDRHSVRGHVQPPQHSLWEPGSSSPAGQAITSEVKALSAGGGPPDVTRPLTGLDRPVDRHVR